MSDTATPTAPTTLAAPAAPATPAGTAGTAGTATPVTPVAEVTPTDTVEGNPTPTTEEADPENGKTTEWYEAQLKKVRAEAAANRTAKKDAEAAAAATLENIKTALGLGDTNTPVDPVQQAAVLAERNTVLETELAELKLNNAVTAYATTVGVDTGKLFNSVRFVTGLKSLDTTQDVSEAVKQLVNTEKETDPTVLTQQAVQQSGPTGNPGTPAPQTGPETMEQIQARVRAERAQGLR